VVRASSPARPLMQFLSQIASFAYPRTRGKIAPLKTLSRPLNSDEYLSKALAFGGVNRFYECHASVKVQTKLGAAFAVLAFRTEANAVGQRGLEAIEVASRHVRSMVCNQTCQVLSNALTHESRLAVMDREALFEQDSRYMPRKALYALLELLIPRKRQIVGIPCICRASGFRQSFQPAIQAITTNVGECRRCGCALRQMGPGIEPTRFAQNNPIDINANLVPGTSWSRIRANTAEQVGHGLRIAKSPKGSLNPRTRKRGKEIPQVHSQDNPPGHVRRDESFDRPSLYEPMGCGMRWHLCENPCENLLLQIL
jgi:hypothetical protein